ncbi:integrase catalytic domain-containing protein [Trichonephila clavipes]|nr:integrase catalytic domain-containing protein [Trichonephila clavipes]
MIVLAWLRKEPMDLKTFVQNRVAKIQELYPNQLWRHVPSDQNPADLVSRGVDPEKLLQQNLWFNGPTFLSGDDYPNRTINCREKLDEYNSELKNCVNEQIENFQSVLNIHVNDFLNDLLNLSNNYITILRVLSFIFRFVENLKGINKVAGPLTTKEFVKAETYLIKKVQEKEFSSDINHLKSKGSVLPNSKLKTLNPFLDDNGVLRVGGRLCNLELSFDKKHQIILPKNNRLTLIIIEYFHKKYLHVATVSLLNHIREKFWPLNGRSMCRKIVYKCIVCFKAKPIVSTQIMGNLPKERLITDYPFNCSGVDFCGPFFIKNKGQRKGNLFKVYICIFVCFVFKAVHIELVSDLTSQAFMAALKRFMARRGKCAKLFSDNGKNFVGASNEIKKLLEIVRKPDEKIANYLAAEGIEWKFIPARSPNFGGLWEAAIKSCKYHLKRVVNGINLTYEELLTVTVQIEGILNSRPLCPLSNNDDDFQVLTPAHFLINRSLISLEEPNLTKCKESNLKKWQKITKIVQLMWKFWSRNYLNQLQQREKWMFEKNNVKIGDLVLIIEENLPTYKWALGRIVELYYGEDKKVRVVKIKTQYTTCKRAISKICVLPMEDP